MRDLLNTLNNYDWSDDQIEIVKRYILNGVLPSQKKKRFIEKYKDFEVKDNKIYYKPLNLEVIPNDKKEETLNIFMMNLKLLEAVKYHFIKK